MKKNIQNIDIEKIEYINSKTVYTLARVYLFFAALIHALVAVMFYLCGQKECSAITICFTFIYIAFGLVVNLSNMRAIYFVVICEMTSFIYMCVQMLGWNYSMHMYSFSIISLAVLTSISDKKDRYEVKYPVIAFLLSHGILLSFRLYTERKPIEYMVELDEQTKFLFEILSVVNYSFVALSSFVPLLGFLVDLNKSNENIENVSAELEYISSHDLLTGLVNRRSIQKKFDEVIDSYNKKGKDFSLILGDIDNFKKVNDNYGHSAGDYVLSTVSKKILDIVDEGEVCRWGGEEILVVVYGGVDKAHKLANEIRETIEKHEFIYNNEKIPITLTQGVGEYEYGEHIEELISKVDEKLYKGKKTTKNCVVV